MLLIVSLKKVTDALRQMHVGLSNIASTTEALRELSVEIGLDPRMSCTMEKT